jgi:hypothetical protein
MACTITPPVFPTTVASAARRPSATPRLTTKSTLGPGTTMSTNAVIANSSRWSPGGIARRLYRPSWIHGV